MLRRVSIALLLIAVLLVFSVGSALAQGGAIHYVQWGESLSSIAAMYDVDPMAILEVNDIPNPDLITVGQRLVIPQRYHDGDPDHGYDGYYTVQPGDTLSDIAFRLDTTATALATANNLGDADMIYVGQVLNVPGYAPNPGARPGPSGPGCSDYYIVEKGDTLSFLAYTHGSTVNEIIQANNLYSDLIYEGQRLCLPGARSSYGGPAAPPAQFYHHTVARGDTLAGIALHYGVNQAAIIQANNINNPAMIYVGRKLAIPGYHAAPQAQSYSQKQPGYETDGHHPATYKKDTTPPGPKYDYETGPVYRDSAYDVGCFSSIDVWVPEEHTTVEAVDTWCPTFDVVDDPDNLSSIVIKTADMKGIPIKIVRGDAVFTIESGANPAYGQDIAYYPTSPGYYQVFIGDDMKSSAAVEFDLPFGKRAWIDYQLTSASENPRPRNAQGWSGQVIKNQSKTEPNQGVWSVIIVRAPAPGLPIRIDTDGEFSAVCYTGQKPELGAGACEFGGLWPGKYTLTLEGSGASVEVYVDGKETAEVLFDAK